MGLSTTEAAAYGCGVRLMVAGPLPSAHTLHCDAPTHPTPSRSTHPAPPTSHPSPHPQRAVRNPQTEAFLAALGLPYNLDHGAEAAGPGAAGWGGPGEASAGSLGEAAVGHRHSWAYLVSQQLPCRRAYAPTVLTADCRALACDLAQSPTHVPCLALPSLMRPDPPCLTLVFGPQKCPIPRKSSWMTTLWTTRARRSSSGGSSKAAGSTRRSRRCSAAAAVWLRQRRPTQRRLTLGTSEVWVRIQLPTLL